MGKEPNLLKEKDQGKIKKKTHTHTEEEGVMLDFPRPACLILCTHNYIYI